MPLPTAIVYMISPVEEVLGVLEEDYGLLPST